MTYNEDERDGTTKGEDRQTRIFAALRRRCYANEPLTAKEREQYRQFLLREAAK